MAARADDIIGQVGLQAFERRHVSVEMLQVEPSDSVAFAGHGGSYGAGQRMGWPAIGLVVAAHAVLLAALCLLDVVHIGRKPLPRLTVVEIRPDPIAPPPAPPEHHAEKTPPVQRPIMAPTPIVATPAPAPIVAAPIAPPVPPAPSAPPSPSVAVSEVAAPISAPDGMARNLGNPAPRYPIGARQRHEEGTVRLRVVITAEGRVKDIEVARSSGFDALDDSALQAVRKWKFVPGKQAGVAVEAVGFLNIPFHLT